ncbi:MAG: 2,3-bisphosphoglycerate-independent phosphoglycerate mutase [Candidatus Ryanbacteria bacterium CG10_big_fil_rev_8_21_14_0_10_43_42]|uniref:2,3-bisphosphoglycerate-independent phosphoglycerate mutase n=1 Tax=Candidatus Ryanbacteria bacterium CG10_big_fil_rev_8_21_14_0_10_43_42 TaxID=1974864 RepID=A0A2M8KXN9_9BACT|nr:MAG: 2,3-bisphosphoglycerate-independent phosphoglycerate mutase [Candidatus Ryanbacteria bacterium CG10_big_fil_rev_8_21_14_0_10_43_42]
MPNKNKPVILIVMDGVGISPYPNDSPFAQATIPTFHELETNWPFTTLRASGVAVGLPWGEEGNSEVGHLTMGAGRIIYHHLPRIITAIQDKSFFENEAFLTASAHVKKRNSTLHLMGLFSTGSVHAYIDHLYALLEFAEMQDIPNVMIHIFTDGRDAPPDEALGFIKQFRERMDTLYPRARIASIIGRHYAMDREENWNLTEQAYNLLVNSVGNAFRDPGEYIKQSYANGKTDEFIDPGYLFGNEGVPRGRVQDGDAVIYYDFREDSVRQLTEAFLSDNFSYFNREKKLEDICFVTMTEYEKSFPALVAFPPLEVEWPLARVISEAHLLQLHVAETEKYAHISYFFNGGREKVFDGEERKLISSQVAGQFIEHPEMAAEEIMQTILSGIDTYDFILANFANGDMVGHTGNFKATVKALEVLDTVLGKIIPPVLEMGGALVITADHGNAEEKRTHDGEPRTKHTANPVPFYVVANGMKRETPRTPDEITAQRKEVGGVLTDVAPTVLDLMNLRPSGEMAGISLLSILKNQV